MINSTVYYTDHWINRTITQFFAKSNSYKLKSIDSYKPESNNIFITYGILRGTDKILKSSKNFIYIDHGYLSASEREFNLNKSTIIKNLSGYFRVVKNDFYFNKNFYNYDKSRFEKLGINLKDLNYLGDKIIVSEPSEHIKKFLNLQNWTTTITNEIKKYSDKEIIVHSKFSQKPLGALLKEAFAFVSCQSTAAYQALAEGVPVYFTHDSLKEFGNIKDIEKKELNHSLLYVAANSQWKLNEFFSNDFKNFLGKIL